MENAYTQIRRQKRAKDDPWIQNFLKHAPFGVMGTCREGQPFLVSRNFVYDPSAHAIYMHGARAGRTYENIQANDRVCFSVSEMGQLLPGERAIEVSVEYAGVVVFGRVVVVEEISEARHGLQLLVEKYFPGRYTDDDSITDKDIQATAVLRIDIESWSGKEHKANEH